MVGVKELVESRAGEVKGVGAGVMGVKEWGGRDLGVVEV